MNGAGRTWGVEGVAHLTVVDTPYLEAGSLKKGDRSR